MGNTVIKNRNLGRMQYKSIGAKACLWLGLSVFVCVPANLAFSQEKQSIGNVDSDKKEALVEKQNTEAKPAAPKSTSIPNATADRIRLFNGKDLAGLNVLEKSYFDGHGKISVKSGTLIIEKGMPGSGIAIDPKVFKNLPKIDYEINFDAMRIEGDDFFCGLTFPVNDSFCTLILGGWGGGAIGLSNVDTMSAIENETSTFEEFKNNVWYNVRLKVTGETITAMLQEKKAMEQKELFSIETKDHKFDIWWEQEPARPLGFTTWSTKAAFQNIVLTPISKKKKQTMIEK